MTFVEKYEYLFTDLNLFGKFYPAKFSVNCNAEDVRNYAKERLNHRIPVIRGTAKSMLIDLNRCNNINEQLS